MWVFNNAIDHPWLGMVYTTTYKNGEIEDGLLLFYQHDGIFCWLTFHGNIV